MVESKKNKHQQKLIKKLLKIKKEKIMNKTKKCSKKLNKTIKNTSAFKNCENFCKNDYMVERKKQGEKNSKKYNVPYNPSKEDNEFTYNTCKKTFCNEKCEGYNLLGKNFELELKKNLNNGFKNTYSKKQIEMLKKKGALSGCVDVSGIYNVFHK